MMHVNALRTYDHTHAVMPYQCLLYLFALSFHLSFVLTDQDTPEKFTINLHYCWKRKKHEEKLGSDLHNINFVLQRLTVNSGF